MHVDRHESFVRMIRGLSISGDVRGISGIGIYIICITDGEFTRR